MTPRPSLDPAAIAVAAPPALLLTIAAAMLAAAAFGYHPLWPGERPTLSEAIVMRDLGALTQWLEERPDMQRRYPVREGMVTERALSLTPFEAIVAARRDDVLLYLRERGIEPTAAELPRLRCLAAQKEAADVLKALGGPLPDCGGVEANW